MSQKIHSAAQEAARRVGGFAVLGVAAVMASLSERPFLSLEAGGISALLVTFVLLLLAARVESRLPPASRGKRCHVRSGCRPSARGPSSPMRDAGRCTPMPCSSPRRRP